MPEWFDLAPDAGVLELPPAPDGKALELHVGIRDGRTVAWWLDERGALLARAVVGEA